MTKTALIPASALTALLLSASAQADIYRCTVDSKVQYTDRPCANGDMVVKSQPERSRNNSAEVRNVAGQNGAMKNRVTEVAAPAPEFGSVAAPEPEYSPMATPREPPLWERRNMSVVCFSQKYNTWSAGTDSRPTEAERERKVSELMRECRDIYRIPQDLPSRGVVTPQR